MNCLCDLTTADLCALCKARESWTPVFIETTRLDTMETKREVGYLVPKGSSADKPYFGVIPAELTAFKRRYGHIFPEVQ